MIKKALLLASVLCVLNQTPVKAEDYASSNDSFGSIELNGKYIQLPCKASLIFDLGFAPEEDMQAPSRSVVDLDYSIMGVSGVTDISWESGKQERSVDIRYEAGVIKNIAAEVRTPEEVFDYPYYDEVGLFNLTGDSYESSVPFKLPTVAVVILLVGVTVLKKYGEEGDE